MKQRASQLLDAVDYHDRVVGTVRRGGVFQARANFRVAHLFLVNSQSRLLRQRLAVRHARCPGRWGSSVAAYVHSGETCRQAILRRTMEELGLDLGSVVERGRFAMAEEQGCVKFVRLFSREWEGPHRELIVERSHIAEIKFVPFADALRIRREEPHQFTPTFVQLLDRFAENHWNDESSY